MSEAILSAFKWCVLAFCAVVGTSALIISDKTGSTKPIMITVLTYGIIYIMSYFWREFRGKLMLMGFGVFLVLTIIAPYLPLLLGFEGDYFDPFYVWGGTVLLFGFPAMFFVFLKWGE